MILLVGSFVKILISKIQIHFTLEPVKSSTSSKLAVELGVGGGVALLVAIVLCIAGIAYYRRFINFCIV